MKYSIEQINKMNIENKKFIDKHKYKGFICPECNEKQEFIRNKEGKNKGQLLDIQICDICGLRIDIGLIDNSDYMY